MGHSIINILCRIYSIYIYISYMSLRIMLMIYHWFKSVHLITLLWLTTPLWYKNQTLAGQKLSALNFLWWPPPSSNSKELIIIIASSSEKRDLTECFQCVLNATSCKNFTELHQRKASLGSSLDVLNSKKAHLLCFKRSHKAFCSTISWPSFW